MKRQIRFRFGWWPVEWELIPWITFQQSFRWGYGHLEFRWLALIIGFCWNKAKCILSVKG